MVLSVRDALRDYGLSDREIKVYLACLGLGTASAQDISQKSKLNRSTTYDVLRGLVEIGIASKTIKKSITLFEVADPNHLLSLLDEKKSKLSSVIDQLNSIKTNVVAKPEITVYEGKDGLKTLLNAILATRKNIDVVSNSKFLKMFYFFVPQYILQKKRLGLQSRVIHEDSKETMELKKKDKEDFRTTRSIKNFNLNSATFICGDKVAILKLSEEEPIGLLVQDKLVADDYRTMF
ncbi:MAG TPA: helix-turn-helix domain-containing protein [archaeon]|nr:helix-turn-helix domain-containing protein [archaeon]